MKPGIEYNPVTRMLVRFAGGALECIFWGGMYIASARLFQKYPFQPIILFLISTFTLPSVAYMFMEGLKLDPMMVGIVSAPGAFLFGLLLEMRLNVWDSLKGVASFFESAKNKKLDIAQKGRGC